jgi:hypothetical protein
MAIKYSQIVFIQNPYRADFPGEYSPIRHFLDGTWEGSNEHVVKYLLEYEDETASEVYNKSPAGTSDETFSVIIDERILHVNYNIDLDYISLVELVEAED